MPNTLICGLRTMDHEMVLTNARRDDNGKIFKRKLRDVYWADAGRRI